MSDKEHTIHDFDVAFIGEYFSSMDRQGPGSPEATIKALSFIDNISEKLKEDEKRAAHNKVYMPQGFQGIFQHCNPLKLPCRRTGNCSAIPYSIYTQP